jgi:hypothetical protein
MTKNFTHYYAVGFKHHAKQTDQLNFFIRSSALVRAFLMAKEQVGLASYKPKIVVQMFNVIDTYGKKVSDDDKRTFVINLGGYVADLNELDLTQRYIQLTAPKAA